MTTHGPDSSVEMVGATLPAHENAPDDPPNPWADAARELHSRITNARLEINSEISRIPVPGCFDEASLIELEAFVTDLERAASRGRLASYLRKVRGDLERQARKA